MLKNMSMKMKLMLFPALFIGLFIILGVIFSYYNNMSQSRNAIAIKTDKFVQQLLKGRISVYQFLRNPNNDIAQKVRDDFAQLATESLQIKDNLSLQQNKELIDSIVSLSKDYVSDFDKFSTLRIKDFSNGIVEESSEVKPLLANMVKTGLALEKELDKINASASKIRDDSFATLNTSMLIVSIISLIVFVALSLLITNILISSLDIFKTGLLGFFSYLNKETTKVELITINTRDEFGQMAETVNENIKKTELLINQDNGVIADVHRVVNEVKAGRLNQRITKDTHNESLQQLKNTFNEMLDNTSKNVCEDINKITRVLNSFAKLNFTDRIENDVGGVAKGLNNLAEIINQMLVENKSNGLTLDESSNILLANVDKLNQSSNEAAASLEETAAALEEMTSNIRNNTENILKMATLANGVTESANKGERLANQTTVAMEEINAQVTAINDAIAVIDQIAFQTNILSLNAAVEAATAGEAGKGFAVVAGEVRNLASRSAEAAKEIKDIVERATSKANEGKSIANDMIQGYSELNKNISHTINLISDIEHASKEQLLGIEQINDAVTQLDQQTQQNAMVASQTHDVAVLTDEIAKLVVSSADEKEFIGKNEVKGKSMNHGYSHVKVPQVQSKTIHKKPVMKVSKVSNTTSSKIQTVTPSQKSSTDGWEAF